MDASHFVVDEQVRFLYAGIYLLYVIEKENHQFSIQLKETEKIVEPIIERLLEQDYISAHGQFYVITQKGRDVLEMFINRYQTFLSDYDIFCGVDIEQREFAFTHYDEYDDMEEWQDFLSEDRWEDLRIAVAEYNGLDPIEIVFMSLIHESRFGKDEEGWSEDLLFGSVWDEIQSICNTALRLKSLKKELDNRDSSTEVFIKDIIERGTELSQELRR